MRTLAALAAALLPHAHAQFHVDVGFAEVTANVPSSRVQEAVLDAVQSALAESPPAPPPAPPAPPPPVCTECDAGASCGVCLRLVDDCHWSYPYTGALVLRTCDSSVPAGEWCEGDGMCATDEYVDNCGEYDIYVRVDCVFATPPSPPPAAPPPPPPPNGLDRLAGQTVGDEPAQDVPFPWWWILYGLVIFLGVVGVLSIGLWRYFYRRKMRRNTDMEAAKETLDAIDLGELGVSVAGSSAVADAA